MMARPAAGGGRWVSVAPERLARWIKGFAERHGAVETTSTPEVVRLGAADGSVAECHIPFPPLGSGGPRREPYSREGGLEAGMDVGMEAGMDISVDISVEGLAGALVAHACRDRKVGVLLVRLGGYAAGVFEGERLVVSKVGSRLVHGRSAAGGWSQQRFARRREKQSSEALRAAADVAFRVLAPHATDLDAVVFGGDGRAIDELRDDRRLASLFALENGPFLTVPDPRLAVLEGVPTLFRAVRIRVVDPDR